MCARASVLWLLAGCGRIGFDMVGVDSDSRPQPWQGDFTLEPPTLVTEVSSALNETECFVVPDATRMYFARVETTGIHRIWTADRAVSGGSFTSVAPFADIASAASDARFVSGDGLHAYFWSTRRGAAAVDIWHVNRSTTSEPFVDANAMLVGGLDTAISEYDPWPTRDNSRLYYMLVDASGQGKIYVADLVTPNSVAGARLVGLETASHEDNPALSEDELFIVFGSNRPGGAGRSDLWYARRSDRTSPFGPAQPLPIVNTQYFESEPCFNDGELFFSSDRPGGLGGIDIYRSRLIPL